MLMQSPLIRGRFFLESDETGKQEVAIIDETTARRYWSGIDPVGRRLRLGGNPNFPLGNRGRNRQGYEARRT